MSPHSLFDGGEGLCGLNNRKVPVSFGARWTSQGINENHQIAKDIKQSLVFGYWSLVGYTQRADDHAKDIKQSLVFGYWSLVGYTQRDDDHAKD